LPTPLRYITFISQILANGLEKDPEKIHSALLDINTTSEKILSGSLNILNLKKHSWQRKKAMAFLYKTMGSIR